MLILLIIEAMFFIKKLQVSQSLTKKGQLLITILFYNIYSI